MCVVGFLSIQPTKGYSQITQTRHLEEAPDPIGQSHANQGAAGRRFSMHGLCPPRERPLELGVSPTLREQMGVSYSGDRGDPTTVVSLAFLKVTLVDMGKISDPKGPPELAIRSRDILTEALETLRGLKSGQRRPPPVKWA